MPNLTKFFVLSALFLCCTIPATGNTQTLATTVIAGEKTSINLQDLRWMTGSWHTSNGQQNVDEHWSLQGESLVGISRTLENNKSKVVELLLIEKQGEDWLLRLRFFGPAIDKATRGKDEPLRLKVIHADAQQLMCEGIGNEIGTTLSYTRIGNQKMQAKISKMRGETLVWQEEYAFERAPLP